MSQSRNSNRNRLADASMAGDRRSGLGLAGSLALHAAVIAATFFTWQHSLEIADESPPIVPVELVTIGAKTNIKAVAPKEEFKPKEEQPAVTPKVETQTAKIESVPVPEVKVPPEPAPAPVAEKKPPAKPKLRPKPEPEKKKQKFDINNVLALLNKQTPASKNTSRAETGEQPRRGIGEQNAMTMDLRDALLNQIEQCWSPPVGAPNAADLIVEFEVFLNPDGSVARPPQLTAQSVSGGPYSRAAVEAARRAIYTCAPYKLPPDRYSQWRDITMTFDPRKMMGQ